MEVRSVLGKKKPMSIDGSKIKDKK